MDKVRVDTRPGVQQTTTTVVERRPSFDWGAAITSSLLGGLAHLVFLSILFPAIYGVSALIPTRLMASVLMGSDVLTPATAAAGPIVVGLLVLAAASIVYGLVGLGILRPFHPVTAYLGGAIFGLVLYFINFYLWSAAFPWFADYRNWVNLFGHILFGLVLGGVYYAIKRRDFYRSDVDRSVRDIDRPDTISGY